MKLLLDTCVLSELRQASPAAAVSKFIGSMPSDSLFISAISLGEIIKGNTLLPASKCKTELQAWVNFIETSYQHRILKIDSVVAGIWGEITGLAQKKGKIIGACDGLIAATAIAKGLHVATRNVNDFEPSGALIINPWEQ